MAEKSVPRLIVVSERDHRFIDLDGAQVGVGRAPENVIVVKDDMVSRKHCVIERTATGFRVRDLKSFNGTYLNGERVNDEPLKTWDSVRVGRTRIFFVDAGAVAAPPKGPVSVGDLSGSAVPPEGELALEMTKQMALPGTLTNDPNFRAAVEDVVRRERGDVERQIGRRLRDESAPSTTPMAAGLAARVRRIGPLDGGGDFYDVLIDDRDPDALIAAVGTVSGQGIAASIAAAGARHAFQGVAFAGTGDILDRLARLRDLLTKTLHPGTAISIVVARALPNGKVRIAAMGGAGALVYRASRREVEVARGVARRDDGATRLDAFDVQLAPEDRLLLASDGAASLRAPGGGEPLGELRLCDALRTGATLPPAEAIGRIVETLVAHGGGAADRDATVVLLSKS